MIGSVQLDPLFFSVSSINQTDCFEGYFLTNFKVHMLLFNLTARRVVYAMEGPENHKMTQVEWRQPVS